MLKFQKTLKQLNLSRSVPPTGMSWLMKGLIRNIALNSLNLSGIQMGNYGAHLIGEALKQNNSLRTLNLSDCKIEREGFGFLVAAIKENSKSTELKSIILKDNNIDRDLLDKLERLLQLISVR